jgi:NADPH:quinone reductase-like Zn-dependent oxidoreductase
MLFFPPLFPALICLRDKLDDLKDLDACFDTVGEQNWFSRARDNRVVKKDGRFITIVYNEEIGCKPNAHPPSPYASYYCFAQDRKIQDELMSMITQQKLHLPIDRQFPFTEEGLREMLQHQKSGDSMGKNLLKICEGGVKA